MRRTSVSLPTKKVAHDPHEKPDRYAHIPNGRAGLFATMKAAFVSQSQKTRWAKTAAIVFTICVLFYWLSPRGVEVYNEGMPSPKAP